MSIDTFKAQAHRLQGYLRSNPDTASRLIEGKQSACYEVIAAVHGARNWNTLCASAPSEQLPSTSESPAGHVGHPGSCDSSVAPDLPPLDAFGQSQSAGTVSYLVGYSDFVLSADLASIQLDGYMVTTVSVTADLKHLALAMGGAAGPVEGFCGTGVAGCGFLSLEFLGAGCRPVPWFEIPEGGAKACTERLIRLLGQRQGRGHVLVLHNLQQLVGAGMGGSVLGLLQAFLKAGGNLVLTARTLAELEGVVGLPVATSVVQGPRRH